jgi:arylsulfatase A-like enzyme
MTFRILLLVVLSLAGGCAREIGRPNVILISMDTTRADHLGVYGYERETTPNLSRLAGEGVVFEQAYTQAPWTVASHMSVFTSLYPPVHKVAHLTPQSATVKLLPELLHDAGYSTAGFVAPVLDGYGFAKGFDHYAHPHRYRSAEIMIHQALEWLAGDPNKPALRGQPFFIFLHLFDPHHTYDPPWPFDTAFLSSYRENILELSASHPFTQEKDLSPDELFEVVGLYDGEIAYTDWALGRFFDELKELGVYDNTLIALMGDHGEGFLEHGLMNHGNSVYEELGRIPLILRFPDGRFRGRRVKSPVRLIDLTPTILDYLREAQPVFSQGLSLLAGIERDEPGTDPVFTYVGYSESIRDGSWKLIRNPPYRTKMIPRSAKTNYELFDLANDPEEKYNLAAENPEEVERLARAMERMDEANQEIGDRINAELDVQPMELTEEQKERLRALGYIQ